MSIRLPPTATRSWSSMPTILISSTFPRISLSSLTASTPNSAAFSADRCGGGDGCCATVVGGPFFVAATTAAGGPVFVAATKIRIGHRHRCSGGDRRPSGGFYLRFMPPSWHPVSACTARPCCTARIRLISGVSVQRFLIAGPDLGIVAQIQDISGFSVHRFLISGPNLGIDAQIQEIFGVSVHRFLISGPNLGIDAQIQEICWVSVHRFWISSPESRIIAATSDCRRN